MRCGPVGKAGKVWTARFGTPHPGGQGRLEWSRDKRTPARDACNFTRVVHAASGERRVGDAAGAVRVSCKDALRVRSKRMSPPQ